MQNAVQKIVGAVGSGFAIGIGTAIVKVVLIFLFVFLAVAVLGILFLILAAVFYKKRKKKLFLIFGILSSLSLSLISSVIISSKLGQNFSLVVIIAPIFFILGLWIVFKKYKNLT